MAGLEPAPLDSSTSFSTARCSTMLNYTAYHIIYPSYKQLAATPAYDIRRRAHPHYWTCNQDSVFQFISSVAALQQPFSQRLTSHTSLGLTLLPICPVCCNSVATITHPVGLTDSEITCVRLLYSRPFFMSPLSTRSSVWSLSMPFRFHQSASPVLQYVSLLAGIARCTSLGVCGRCGSRTRLLT